MKAIGLVEFGGPEVLRVVDLPQPQPGPGEVRIRVHAVAVNPSDTLLRKGVMAARLASQPLPHIPGMDAAGVIDELGPGADSRLQVGQNVIALVLPTEPCKGSYAEFIVVPQASVVAMPSNVDYATASTLLMNAMTARLALDAFDLQPGDTIGVTGAAGSLGGYAIQLGKADGLRVVADASEADRPLVKSLGADVVVERGDAIATRMREVVSEGVRAVVDGAMLHDLIVPAIADNGRLATFRGWSQNLPRGITVHPIFVRFHAHETDKLDRLRQQAEHGVLTMRVAKVLPASQAGEAHRLLERGGLRGRIVLDFASFVA